MTIPEGYIQVTHLFGGVSAPLGAAVVYGVKNDALLLTADAYASALHDAFGDTLLTELATDINLTQTLVKFGPDSTGAIGSFTGTRAGSDTFNGASPAVAYLMTKQSAIGGRRGRGRMYLPGVGEGNVDQGGNVLPLQITQLNTKANDFLARLELENIPMVLLHDPATEWVLVNGQPRRVPTGAPPPIPSPVLNLSAASKVGTQRRRNRR